MSADLNMSISMRGSQEELAAMLKVLHYYETVKGAQYNASRNCAYIDWVQITSRGQSRHLDENNICELAAMTGSGELTATAGGPYGHYAELQEVGLFEAMADAAPNAWFSCSISGFVGSVDVSHSAELKDGQLNVYASDTDEDPSYLYVEDFLNKVSHSEFCELFQVDEEEYDEEVYEEFIFAAANQGVFDDLDVDELFYDRFSDLFCEYFEDNEAEADVIEAFRNKLCDLGVESLEEFMFFADLSDPAKSYTYDPISRITTFGSSSCDEDDEDDDFDEDDEDDDFDEDDED